MTRQSLLFLLLLSGSIAFAQTQQTHTTHKPATAHHATSGPTKVTGTGVTTPSGLQYWDIKVGTGPTALRGEKVRVDYTGWLTNGKKFDSSVGTGKPFEFDIGEGQRQASVAHSATARLWAYRHPRRADPAQRNPDLRCEIGLGAAVEAGKDRPPTARGLGFHDFAAAQAGRADSNPLG